MGKDKSAPPADDQAAGDDLEKQLADMEHDELVEKYLHLKKQLSGADSRVTKQQNEISELTDRIGALEARGSGLENLQNEINQFNVQRAILQKAVENQIDGATALTLLSTPENTEAAEAAMDRLIGAIKSARDKQVNDALRSTSTPQSGQESRALSFTVDELQRMSPEEMSSWRQQLGDDKLNELIAKATADAIGGVR